MPLPKDPGIVNASVVDQDRAPVANAWVAVEMPSNIGNLYWVSSPTRADGTVSFPGVPAGRRRVELTVPSGFTAGATPISREVDVVKNQATTVSFDIVRK